MIRGGLLDMARANKLLLAFVDDDDDDAPTLSTEEGAPFVDC